MATRTLKATAVTSMSALALAAASQASAFEFQAGDTDVSIYGYVTGKVAYDIDGSLGDATGINITNIDDDAESGHVDFDATESRLGFRTSTDANGDDLVTVLEGDFRGGSLRLRHAYGTWNNILAGQTWSNFNSFVGFTPTVDFNSAAGAAGLQDFTAQVRYSVDGFSVALEQPLSTVTNTAGIDDEDINFRADTKNSLPAVTARFEGAEGPLGYSVAGLVRQVELADGSDDDIGFGALVAASYDMGVVTLRGNVQYMDGANRYLYHSGVDFFGTDAYVDDDGNLETVSGVGGTIGASFDAGPGTFNVVYGRTMQDDTEFTGDNESQQSVFANYMWSPAENLTYGVEAAYVQKETAETDDQDDPDATRVSFAATYNF